MKKILLILAALVLAVPCFAQNKTTVTGTILTPSGAPASGTITITNPSAFISADGYYVAASTKTVVSLGSSGSFSVSLIPNENSAPASYYDVSYALGSYDRQPEYWVIPASGPVTLAQVEHFTSPTVVDETLSQATSATYTLAPNSMTSETLTWPRAFADTNYILTSLALIGGNGYARIAETTIQANGITVWLENMDLVASDSDITVTLDAAAVHN